METSPDTKAPALPRPWSLHLLALGAFAVAQPLFDVLGRGATFFVARRAGALDVGSFALVAAFLPGLVAVALVA
ncbi:MAG TPA: hypothetical protein VMT18_10730, partial [Planctomycetota bacterium]|nr:hypothetical protein [Planctomycetota bacterium]